MRVNLILEGGGMRGIYTAGVLDFLMEKGLIFLDVIGVSAGALNAISYKSNQPYRTKETYLDYSYDKRYLSLSSLVKTKNLFGVNFIFNTIPDELLPFDYVSYNNSEIQVRCVVTNLDTGRAEYHVVSKLKNDLDYLIATSSLPFVSRIVEINENKYLDGGIADSIPIRKSIEDGYDLHVLVLTREEGYRKKRNRGLAIVSSKYKEYPKFMQTLLNRDNVYNETLDYIKELEKNKKVFVISPSRKVTISRFEKDKQKLEDLYNQGYNDINNKYEELLEYIKDATNIRIRG